MPSRKAGLLFEIETDKAAMEIDAPSDGIIRNITAAEGADCARGASGGSHLSGRRNRFGTRCFRTLTPGEAHYTGTSSRCGTNGCTPCGIRIWTFSCNSACQTAGKARRNYP